MSKVEASYQAVIHAVLRVLLFGWFSLPSSRMIFGLDRYCLVIRKATIVSQDSRHGGLIDRGLV